MDVSLSTLDWRGVSLLATLLMAWSGFLIAIIKLLLGRVTRDLDKRLDAISQTQSDDSKEWRSIERELMALKANIPLHYVRREDYVRGQSVIEAKLDALAGKLETTRLEGIRNER